MIEIPVIDLAVGFALHIAEIAAIFTLLILVIKNDNTR